ncbi:hypothetical protein FJT64_021886 [Amphibalanus amphitrite]|uniref:Uncharacterized protein n=1 Tax=Amphibalanus amphitrite TaxID=1232801 RepID=A0A6A4WN34_AMPAM|nr:hypothetical protein FJT64_021886 [Amphibalanus amphitrite]
MSAISRVHRQLHVSGSGSTLTLDAASPRWLDFRSSAMPSVVKKEVKTSTKRDPQHPEIEIITTETIETLDDGSSTTTIKTVKKGPGLDTFHKETRQALEDSKPVKST